jgi:Ankyrin repeat
VLHAVRGGIIVAIIPVLWSYFCLPSLSSTATTVASVLAVPVLADHLLDSNRKMVDSHTSAVRLFGRGSAALLLLAIPSADFLPWLVSLAAGTWPRHAPKWHAKTPTGYGLHRVFEEMTALGIEAEPAIYADDVADQMRDRAMLELPFERVIISHDEPVHTRDTFERALELPQRPVGPLHQAAYRGNLDRVRSLVAAGADVTARDERFDATALDWGGWTK